MFWLKTIQLGMGEIEAIREASKNLQTPHLDGAILYTSAEPCPMCLSASYWAHIKEIYYGATYDDVMNYAVHSKISRFEMSFKKTIR